MRIARPIVVCAVTLTLGCNLFGGITPVPDAGSADAARPDAKSMTDTDVSVSDASDLDHADSSADADDADDADATTTTKGWKQLALGDDHTCILHESGRVWCWGDGTDGKLGSLSETDVLTPVEVETDIRFVSITAGDDHTCGLDESGHAWCWGNGEHIGAPGGANQFAPFQPNDGIYKKLEAGHDAVCGIDMDDNLKCWGENDWYQLGVVDPPIATDPVDPAGGFKALDVSLGYEIMCALDLDGNAVCFGRDLGFDPSDDDVPPPVEGPQEIAANASFVQIETGRNHACALDDVGRAHCWGEPELVTELSVGGSATSAGLIPTPQLFDTLDSGEDFSCGLSAESQLFCWGSNYRGRQGQGIDNPNPSIAEPVERSAPDEEVRFFALGAGHGCAVTIDDRIICWGRNAEGRLGNGIRSEQAAPVEVETDLEFKTIAAGEYAVCGTTTADDVYCWGRGRYDALGNGSLDHQSTPVPVPGLKLAQMESSSSHVCGYTPAGIGWCWGTNNYGVLGNGSSSDSNVPVMIDTSQTFVDITTGATRSCGIYEDGTAVCWGQNTLLGIDMDDNDSPLSIRSMNNHPLFVDVAAGRFHVCGLDSSGDAHCFGDNGYGQLGNDSTTDSNFESVAVTGGHTFLELSAGKYFTCGIDDSNAGWCWGHGAHTGDDGNSSDRTPVAVVGGHQFQTLAPAPDDHICAVTTDGDVYCWGKGSNGRLGNGQFGDRNSPQLVELPEAATDVAAGGSHSCAVGESGQPYCWGLRDFGRLGDDIDTVNSTPVVVDISGVE